VKRRRRKGERIKREEKKSEVLEGASSSYISTELAGLGVAE
jgi:hypothetical protein